ncbi:MULTISPECIES: 5,6-dimethylbenzimidazole synthase [Methylococcus]|jgi:5,6-dimethylbenzimidazole synthase|uniref:5,6-dimethylbenzimidazole synthase n=1 Tax=Methylococcus capsulatus TaxID=414 RepID=A0AA35XZ03_METCP|nr:5,6-dimethylbenzimidazole synthase [Methylococcus capsulatus]QXP91524.1 5,6-dimethylbenzimidazole synthase [Methylococcus capsulatus]UQN12115.1 5,6-dimethylbenzimidazole synthase [Methylococcus capsulatus]CAI8840575.1 5,6-dimethylbenzimidazole synthase [Methylococcus capsulatus]
MTPPDFTPEEIETVYRVIRERRDMRHFRPDPVDPAVLRRLLWAAHQAPSVGFMQPWRFIRITDRDLRGRIHDLVETERRRTAEALGDRADEFRKLKIEGIRECAELLAAVLTDGRERHVFGRRTLPEMDLASLACAIQNLWLAARAEGLGMGWVSFFDPVDLAGMLEIPPGGKPVALLCLGHVESFYPRPLLESAGWERRRDLEDVVFENRWNRRAFGVEG